MMNKSTILKDLIISGKTLLMPDAYDPLSAKIIEEVGFKAVQCSGYSFSLAACYQDETHYSYTENLEITRKIINAVNIPVMADGEDGFGNLKKLKQTVREFIRTGTAGINIEDQLLNHNGKKIQVISEDLMIRKIKIVKDVCNVEKNPDFVLNARTDVLYAVENREKAMEQAVTRANLYLNNGADLAFVVGVKTLKEVEILVNEIKGPLSIAAGLFYNMDEYSIKDLKRLGVARVSFPVLPVFSAIKGVYDTLKIIRDTDGFEEIRNLNLICSKELLSKIIN